MAIAVQKCEDASVVARARLAMRVARFLTCVALFSGAANVGCRRYALTIDRS